MGREMVRSVEKRRPGQGEALRVFPQVSESGFLGLITLRSPFNHRIRDLLGRVCPYLSGPVQA